MRLGKIELGKKVRVAILLLLMLLLAASLYNLYRVYREPTVVSKNLPVYSYEQRGQIDYQVQIRPNSIFNETTLGPGQTYYAKLVKSIDAVCSYRFTADAAAEMKADYRIVAVVEAPKMWRKEFILVPETAVQATGKTLVFSRPFAIDLESYNQFLKSVNEELGVNAREPRLVIRADIDLEARSAAGRVAEKLAPTMEIPLTSGEFRIVGNLTPQKSAALTRTVQIPDPDAQERRIKACIPPVALFLLLVVFSLVTAGRSSAGPDLVEVVWRQHGDRMVRAGDDFSLPEDLITVSLSSLEDLVKVADEAGKPLIYQEGAPPHKFTCYVIDGLTVYSCRVAEFDQGINAAALFSGRTHHSAGAAASRRDQSFGDT